MVLLFELLSLTHSFLFCITDRLSRDYWVLYLSPFDAVITLLKGIQLIEE